MTDPLKQGHPGLMVPYVFTFATVIYINQALELNVRPEPIRDALISTMPPGTGVGAVHITNHGVYEGPQGVTRK